ncbi:hypothetical protein Cs7R123_29740 [Catellatospora sp. TT07R-123]|uniref:hypothetical protein n=1 Tax=Catellatospora sp. TT07R-123 TaxID=2733863 RepID=UPI001B14C190|nr:hypothetical protein [Catellatospora sp. TT07R-123]GHJ45632.1 hypothetical protein Cs7R123_29740 [Catellatospora sp. TT07R-123]
MRVTMATEAAPGRPDNEDQVFHYANVVGVLDGVSATDGLDSGCMHGPAWYTRQLVVRLKDTIDKAPTDSLSNLLGTAIEQVMRDHPDCDLSNPSTPAATVCMVRENGPELEYLILCDSSLIVDRGTSRMRMTDKRFERAITRIRQEALAGDVAIDSEEHAARLRVAAERKRLLTNTPEGYWIAAATPVAAEQAITGRLPLTGPRAVRRAALLSDGASCAVDTFDLYSLAGLLNLLTEDGPEELIRQVRQAENADGDGYARPRYKRHDDATVALCLFEETR